MPRKFRPPTAKRRKPRATDIPYEFGQSGALPSADNGALDEDAPILAVDVANPPPEPEDRLSRETARIVGERHVSRDYSYVRGEVIRIVVIAAFLIAALAITATLRN